MDHLSENTAGLGDFFFFPMGSIHFQNWGVPGAPQTSLVAQRSLEGYSPWSHKEKGHNLATKQQQQKHV